MRPHQSSSGEICCIWSCSFYTLQLCVAYFLLLSQWPRLWCAERRTPKRSGCFLSFSKKTTTKKHPCVEIFKFKIKHLIFSPLLWCASQLKCWSTPKATTRDFLFFLCTLVKKFDCFVLFAAVAQSLRCCAAEPKDTGLIPGCGSQFSDRKAKTPGRWDFGAC